MILLLQKRFDEHPHRHPHIHFDDIKSHLESNEALLQTVYRMEDTGGEPDVFSYEGTLYFVDFSKESPLGRRNVCYDEKARLSRKKFPPESSAEKIAKDIGIKLLDEKMYHQLQEVEPLDQKTSSWIQTPEEFRKLGGALTGDRRYNRTFTYHNGADSYYGVRGFRGYILIK
jgi:hypothetical protein